MTYCIAGNFRGVQFSRISLFPRKLDPWNNCTVRVYNGHDSARPWKLNFEDWSSVNIGPHENFLLYDNNKCNGFGGGVRGGWGSRGKYVTNKDQLLIRFILYSVYLRDCHDCQCVVACQQFRMKNCRKCSISLFTATQPVIEASSKIKFACFQCHYPQQDVSPASGAWESHQLYLHWTNGLPAFLHWCDVFINGLRRKEQLVEYLQSPFIVLDSLQSYLQLPIEAEHVMEATPTCSARYTAHA
jgi:hypothetical protein